LQNSHVHKWREREKSAVINFAHKRAVGYFYAETFNPPYLCRVRAIYPRNLNADYPRSAVSRERFARIAGLFLHASHIQSIAPTHRERVQFCMCVHGVSGELVRPPNLAHRERKNSALGAASALANESIFEIGRRPTAARSFGKIVMRRFV